MGCLRFPLPAALLASALILVAAVWPLLAPRGLTAAPATEADVDAEERYALTLINQQRLESGLPALQLSARLQAAAEWMSLDQARDDVMRHDDSLGRGLRDRLNDFGYPSNTWIAENVAWGTRLGGAEVVPLWVDSAPHRANLLAEEAVAAGLARASVDGVHWYWTLDLGSRLEDTDRLEAQAAPAPPSVWALVGWAGAAADVAAVAELYGWDRAVFGWDPAAGVYRLYSPQLPDSLNSLDQLETGAAYWVQLASSAAAPMLYAADPPSAVALSPGLNLVTWVGGSGVGLAEAVQSIGPGLIAAWAWDFATQRYSAYSPNLPAGLPLPSLAHGDGLWIRVDRPLLWEPPR